MTPENTRIVDLPDRQRDVLDLLIEGLTNQQIGRRLHITEDTVKTHVRRIFKAMGTVSRTEATNWVLTGRIQVNDTPVAAPPAGQQGAPFTVAERKTAQDLWARLGREPLAYATPEQLLAFMRACPDEVGLKYAARIIAAQQAEAHCFQADHEGLVGEFWERERQAAEQRERQAAEQRARDAA